MPIRAILERLVAAALLLLAGGCTTSQSQPLEKLEAPERSPTADSAFADRRFLEAEVVTVGLDAISESPVVVLRELESGNLLPIWVGFAEAQAIAASLHGVDYARPMTHDLMSNLLSKLAASLEEVLIHDLKDGTYYGLLKLRVDGRSEPLLVDSRPSDALALALRTGAAIRLAKHILAETPEFELVPPGDTDQVVRVLGLTVVAPTQVHGELFGLPDRPGLLVTRAEGSAARQGMRRGDLIVEINGEIPHQPIDLLSAVHDSEPGTPVRLTYWREGEEHAVDLLPELPPPDETTAVAILACNRRAALVIDEATA